MILLAEFFFDGGNQLKRVASDFYYSMASDSIGVKEFAGRIVGRPSFKSSIGCVIWGGKSATSIGDIELTNVDGGISDWVDLDFRDCRCVLRLVAQGAAYDTSVIAQICIIDDVQRDGQSVIVKLRGTETLLERSLQPLLYDATTAAENVTLIGNPVPITIGAVRQVEPANSDVNDLGFQESDSLVTTDVVYSGGSVASTPAESPDDYALTDTGFVMLTNPSARITADAHCPFAPSAALSSNLYNASAWTGSNPNNWTMNDGPGSHSRVVDVGIRLVNTLSGYYPQMDFAASDSTWYFVIGEIADLESGGIQVEFGDTPAVEIRRQGRFFACGKTSTSGTISIRGLPDSDVTLRFVTIYECLTSVDYQLDETVLKNLFIRAGMRVTGSGQNIDAVVSSLTLPGYSLGIYVDDSIAAFDAIQKTLDSFCGYMRTDNLGTIRLGYYSRPTGTPVVTLSRLNMTRYPRRITDPAPGLSTRFAGQRNWSPYTDNELAGITFPNRPPFMAEYRVIKEGVLAKSINRAYSHALSAPPIETMLTAESDIQFEASRVCEIAQDKHPYWDIEFALDSVDDIAEIRPGAIALLDDELFEADNGKIALIVEVDGAFGQNIYRVVTWGAETP